VKLQTFFTTALSVTLVGIGVAAAAPLRAVGATFAAPLLIQKDVIGMPGKEVRVMIVDSPPGASSPVHRHNAQVFVYLLSGRMTMQVKDSAPVTLSPGQMFYEGPEDIHAMSKNASNTEAARFLVFMIIEKGAAVSVPVK
jgi:quercetin dioxygenase-like cupin family protein